MSPLRRGAAEGTAGMHSSFSVNSPKKNKNYKHILCAIVHLYPAQSRPLACLQVMHRKCIFIQRGCLLWACFWVSHPAWVLLLASRGATGEEQESPKNLKVLLTRSPSTCCAGFLRGEAQGQAGISPPVSTRAGEMLGTGRVLRRWCLKQLVSGKKKRTESSKKLFTKEKNQHTELGTFWRSFKETLQGN